MNEEFKSLQELYNRVKPALYSKLKEIHSMGFNSITEKDIWNYLVTNNWRNRVNLELHELISDILYADNYKIYEYVVNILRIEQEVEELEEK